jgi:hypothetical protein
MIRTASSWSRSAGENSNPNAVVQTIMTIVAMPMTRVACVAVPADLEAVVSGARVGLVIGFT